MRVPLHRLAAAGVRVQTRGSVSALGRGGVRLHPTGVRDSNSGTTRTKTLTLTALAIAAILIAFYDGIMGPGTGTFMIIALTAVAGMTFLESSATVKVLNSGVALGVANIIGAQIGTHMALGRGAGFDRVVLLVVVVMVGKLG
ncbi:putative membrane protein YfcA [Mycobacteroides chelonae]|nr:putative membrane protein YfcA [Mycobacteroides chelonae]